MAKGILEFDLSDNFEEEQFQLAVKSKDFYFAITDFDEYLRKIQKYGTDDNPNATEFIAIETVRAKLQEYLNVYDVHLDMLS